MEPHQIKRSPLALTALVLALVGSSTAIPYTASSIFLSPQHNDSLAWILQPSSSTAGKTEFLSLNLSTSINTTNPSYHTLLEQTPFQSTEQTSAFVPVIDDQGIISVYAGNCHDGSENGTLWRFHPDNTSSIGNGTWSQSTVNRGEGWTRPNYLAAGFTFASNNSTETAFYSFGGMCPFANSTDSTWVSAANYSQSMVLLDSASLHDTQYHATITGNRAPPVREAGMVAVPLPATYSATESQQDFLFIGGHTQQAFLNMSQLAIFSVPQESWSFVTITSETKPKTELAVRDGVTVEPRSGHAAVLSEDGKKVFVVGGWVGDTSTPADPQFAVLEIGDGYGGSGEWTWTTPSSDGVGIADGTGIFGHSVSMLPGGVLIIGGGYTIPKQSLKRSTVSTQRNSEVYLYNTTSNTWVTSYTNPSAASTTKSASTDNGLSTGQKAGLGVGLGLGIPIVLAIALCAWRYHRKRAVRSKRDSQLRELALGAERAHFWGRDDPHQASSIRSSQMSEKLDPGAIYPWSGNRHATARPESWNDQGDTTAEQTGLLADASSPSQNSRPMSQQKSYRMSIYSEYRRSDATSDIHPIDEREEDEANFRERLLATVPADGKPTVQDPDDPFSDTPFSTPRSTIFGVGLGPFYTRRKENGSLDTDGRVSPAKSDRTSTNLSDSSAFSFSSATTRPTGQVNQSRAILVDRPLSWGSNGGHSLEHITAGSTHSRETAHSDPDGMAPSEKSISADSYSTAHSTFSRRQTENDSLLYDASEVITPMTPIESSPSKLPSASKPRASDWMLQTVRRALTLTRRGTTTQRESDDTAYLASGIDRRSTIIGSGTNPGSSGASTPRRAVSASAELFRRKQGARDWNAKKRLSDGGFGGPRSTRDDLFLGAPGYLGDDETCDEEDWDVEGAAEGRQVQMTYTVPRERLRVVNASARDMDNISERSISRSIRSISDSMQPRRVSG
ncbi:hypothetical protein N7462_006940 [Penicillium macrosclerotiorum]|uniref:uncharacterized protein n=1 Tax=Penicillium macrosclerotiorum TaxID=303699 RepID=UPI0025493A27|nr:uncharacterized protein N7462_006940 [Penicillium macrosclerotiorum]KAJ5678696.1 hypothetical protein N7462_006940 [Penicillium macrosclerotiorum]